MAAKRAWRHPKLIYQHLRMIWLLFHARTANISKMARNTRHQIHRTCISMHKCAVLYVSVRGLWLEWSKYQQTWYHTFRKFINNTCGRILTFLLRYCPKFEPKKYFVQIEIEILFCKKIDAIETNNSVIINVHFKYERRSQIWKNWDNSAKR